ncbi:hypothetical protein QBC46DRAFT_396431 [Diplogelasinospora grovesii]|uniref:Voltage-gated hydrogen channel 1 n=1 Tax=Diplogelasinospora grovesii TaxID=303347 RepID=A0AAN6MYK0_9PEZI|nr:hypothetical protein QBC46DRAFT_396431 [Diplogelasinospora grovesii]
MPNTTTTNDDDDDDQSSLPLLGHPNNPIGNSQLNPYHSRYRHHRTQTKQFLASKTKHYIILGLVALDVAGILADIFIALISCDLGESEEPWVESSRDALHVVGLIFSSLFLVELGLSIWAYGIRFFQDWFHCFDAFVIVASFVIDLLTHGIVEEIGSLIIILRLWRFVKIVEELSVGAAERMEEIEAKVMALEKENEELKGENGELKGEVQRMREEYWEGRDDNE